MDEDLINEEVKILNESYADQAKQEQEDLEMQRQLLENAIWLQEQEGSEEDE